MKYPQKNFAVMPVGDGHQTHLPPIELSEPFPLLDPGHYVAICVQATFAWARQWQKWIVRLVLEPQNYGGRPYTGRLCKFLGLGKDPQRPYAGPQTNFRHLLVEVNGGQPVNANASVEIFVGVLFEIEVVTVRTGRDGQQRPPEHWYSVVREIHPCSQGTASPRTLQPSNPVPCNPLTPRTQSTLTTDQHSNTVNTPLAVAAEKQRCQALKTRGKGADEKFG